MTPSSSYESRFQPHRSWKRVFILASLASVWVLIRLIQSYHHDAGDRIARLEEKQYQVVDVLSPFELILQSAVEEPSPRQIELATAQNAETARVRLLGVRKPWQWKYGSRDWESAARDAVRTWINDQPVETRLSRRQISEDGVLLTHLCRDGELLSDFLVRQGWMAVDPDIDPSDGAIRSLRRAEDEARLAARGIWSGRAMGMLDQPGL